MIKEIEGRWTCTLCGYSWSAKINERTVPAVCECESPNDKVAKNVLGWFALRHKDGWWIGNEDGVTCYAERKLAQYALALVWQREGGRQLDYRIHRFTGVTRSSGVHTPKYSSEEALLRYARRSYADH